MFSYDNIAVYTLFDHSNKTSQQNINHFLPNDIFLRSRTAYFKGEILRELFFSKMTCCEPKCFELSNCARHNT